MTALLLKHSVWDFLGNGQDYCFIALQAAIIHMNTGGIL